MKMKDYLIEFYNEVKDCKDANQIHTYIQNQVTNLAAQFGYVGVKEYRCDYVRKKGITKGRIDVVWVDSENNVIFALEIDSKVRVNSYKKLNKIQAKNKYWFYMGDGYKFISTNKRYNSDYHIKIIAPNMPSS